LWKSYRYSGWVDQLVSESEEENGEKGNGSFTIRTRVTPNEQSYLSSLLGRTINPPFAVRYVEKILQGTLSNVVMKEFNELV